MAVAKPAADTTNIYEYIYEYDVKELTTVAVTVYKDRAEVKRTLSVTLDSGHDTEVLVRGLSSSCDLDSIRVEGTGNATILEVTCSEKLEPKPEGDEDAAFKTLEAQIEELDQRSLVLEAEKERVNKRRMIVVGLGDQVKAPSDPEKKNSSASHNLLSAEGLAGVMKFMDLYSEQLQRCDDEAFQLDAKIKVVNEEIAVLRERRHQTCHGTGDDQTRRQASILLDVKEAGEITLTISYLVTGASWVPAYDIRAFSNDKIVKITYFGLIRQRSGEDWVDTKLSLSTAQPSVGGDVPVLPSQRVRYKRNVGYNMQKTSARNARHVTMVSAVQEEYDASVDDDDTFGMCLGSAGLEEAASPPPSQLEIQTSEVQSGAMSTSYEVARRSSIPSDNTEHKVTVAMFDLKSEFEHFSVPKMVASSFLKAKLINDSPYLILAGPSSIFVDNNFVAKSTLPNVSPAEKFECSLGVDFAVRIDYKPRETRVETSGYFNKATLSQYKQVIEVKNTHLHDVTMQVEEQLPRSEDDKIKVVLVTPVIPKEKRIPPDAPLNLNSKGNIVWRSVIPAGLTESFLLHYTVEKPADSRELVFTEV